MNRYVTWLLLLLLPIFGCEQQSPPGPAATASAELEASEPPAEPAAKRLVKYPNRDYSPPFSALLANPDHFHGRKVQVRGFLTAEFEGTALYLTRDHADYHLSTEGVWVHFDEIPKELHRKYVLIEATFDKDDRGHMSLSSGALKNVERIYELRNTVE